MVAVPVAAAPPSMCGEKQIISTGCHHLVAVVALVAVKSTHNLDGHGAGSETQEPPHYSLFLCARERRQISSENIQNSNARPAYASFPLVVSITGFVS